MASLNTIAIMHQYLQKGQAQHNQITENINKRPA